MTSTGQQRYDLVIVGGGPAALAAAFYARTRQLNVVMVYEELGGKLGWRHRFAGPARQHPRVVPEQQRLGDVVARELFDLEDEYIPGNEVVRLLISRTVMQAGLVVHDRALRVVVGDGQFEVQTRGRGALPSAAVLVATGATPVTLNIPGARHLAGQGLLYSITTYAHLVAGKQVAVIGATQRALHGVVDLARTAAQVYLIVPDDPASMRPLLTVLQQLPNVDVLAGYAVLEVLGAAAVEGLVVACQGQSRRLDVQRAFVDLGLTPNSDLVQGIVTMDEAGFIVVDSHNQTTSPGVFAVGDVTTTLCEQALVAVGDGVRAAMHVYDYLLARRPGPLPIGAP